MRLMALAILLVAGAAHADGFRKLTGHGGPVHAAAASGDLPTARKMLRKARQRDTEHPRAAQLAALLDDG